MPHHICCTCGTRYPDGPQPPPACRICTEPRQYVPPEGQLWTTMEALAHSHRNTVEEVEPGLHALYTVPHFAIGQRAFVVQTPAGNVLWDCVTLLDDDTERRIRGLGGLAAVAVCHPHYYSSMAAFAKTFDCPVYLHAADRRWVVQPDERIRFFEEEQIGLPGGLRLLRTGGHFAGSTVLHWPAGAGGRGVILAGDTLKTTADGAHVSFVRSSPNDLPLSADDADHVVACLRPYAYDRLYSFRRGMVLPQGAKTIVRQSAHLHREATEGRYPGGTALSNETAADGPPGGQLPSLSLSNPAGLADPTGYGFSQVATVAPGARLIYTAGLGGGRADGSHPPDFRGEVQQCLANVQTAVTAAGGSMATVAKVTILVVGFDSERHAVLTEALKASFSESAYPVSTLIPVARLAGDDMQIEIEAVAVANA